MTATDSSSLLREFSPEAYPIPGRSDAQAPTAEIIAFPVHRPSDLLAMTPPDDFPILSDGKNDFWVKGSTALVLGGCGIGKSRWVLSLATADILGREFCGFKTYGAGRWLLLGSENSVHRMRTDLSRIIGGGALTPEQIAKLDDNLAITAFAPGVDVPATNLDSPEVVRSFAALSEKHRPDVVVVDPWEAFVRNGDVNDASETRQSVNSLQRIFRPATVLIVHHSREGADAVKSASGFSATGFTKGSKTLTTMARLAFNLTPLHPPSEVEEKGHGIVINCGKANDSRGFSSRAVNFNEEDGTYSLDGNFDAQAYRDDVDGKRSGATVPPTRLVEVVRSGATKTGDIIVALGEPRSTVNRAIKNAVTKGYLKSAGHGQYALGPKAASIPESSETKK